MVVFMVRTMRYLNLALIVSLIMLSTIAVSAACDDISNLKRVISTSNDPKIDTQDLAFFLAMHNYDATPKGSYVEVKIDSHIYKVALDVGHPEIGEMSL